MNHPAGTVPIRAPLLRLVIAVFVGQIASQPALAGGDKPVDLLEVLRTEKLPAKNGYAHLPIDPQWVGTVKTVLPSDVSESDLKQKPFLKPDNMRLNEVWLDRSGHVVVARAGKYGYTAPAVFIEELPSIKELSEVKTLDQLRKWFGPQHGWTDGWGSGHRMHWSQGWTYFNVTKDEKLRWLNIFALVSGPGGKARDTDVTVDELTVREGLFRPANLVSAEEKALYKSADEIEAEYEKAQAERRAKLPEPLRELVAAKETPGDSDLIAYAKALSEIRRDPKPELFQQFAARIDDGTGEIEGYAEDILTDDNITNLKIEPWQSNNRHRALGYAAAALAQAATPFGLEKMVGIVIAGLGGGRIQVQGKDGRPIFDVEVTAGKHNPDGSWRSYGYTQNVMNVDQGNLHEVAELIEKSLQSGSSEGIARFTSAVEIEKAKAEK